MKLRNIFPWLLGLMLLATTSPILTACSSSDDDNDGGTEKPGDEAIKYDDLAVFQKAICTIDSAGKLVRYDIGEAINKSEPEHRYIGVEDIEAQSLCATVAPNPARNNAIVHFFNPVQGQVQFELYSLQGQLLQREAAAFGEGAQQYELALHDITKGFYLLRIKHDGG